MSNPETTTKAGVTTGSRSRTRTRVVAENTQVSFGAAFKRLLQGLGSKIAGIWEYLTGTLQPTGWLAAVLILALPVFLILGWTEFLVLSIVALVLILLALPFLIGAIAYRVKLELEGDHVVAGKEITGNVYVENISKSLVLRGKIDLPVGDSLLEISVPTLMGGATYQHHLNLAGRKRAIIDVGPAISVREDPLAFLRREKNWQEKTVLYIHPETVQIPSTDAGVIKDLDGRATSDIVDSDLSFHAIRQYVAGDNPRNIHWRSTAKTGVLMVRQYEESRRSKLAVVLDTMVQDYADEDEFELAVSAAASLSVRAIRDNREMLTVVSKRRSQIKKLSRFSGLDLLPTKSHRTVLDAYAGLNWSEEHLNLAELSELVAESVNDLSIVFAFCGSNLGPKQLQRIALKYPLGVQVVIVQADQSQSPTVRRINNLLVMRIGTLTDFSQQLARLR